MKKCSQSIDVHKAALKVLCAIISCQNSQHELLRLGLDQLIKILQSYSNCEIIQSCIFMILAYLLKAQPETIRSKITEYNVIETILKSISVYTCEQLLQYGISCLGGLAYKSEESRKSIVDNNGINIIISTMHKNYKSAPVQKACCYTLCHISRSIEYLKLINTKEVLDLLKQAKLCYIDDDSLLHEANCLEAHLTKGNTSCCN